MNMRITVALLSIVSALTLARAEISSPMMHALVIHSFGGPEVLKYEEVPRPEPKDDQVLVRLAAAALNPVDTAVRQGFMRQRTGEKFPMIIGYDIAGVVEKVGAKVTKLKVGDPVYAYLTMDGGGYAEYAVASEKEAVRKPKALTFEEAAAVPLAGSTAWQALIDTAKLQSGQTVLIHGGSGGVGSLAVQIAKARGAKVIATASTANQETLKQLGVDQAIDYTQTKFEEQVKDVDVVLDTVGKDTLARSYGVVKKGGIVVTIAGKPDQAEAEKRGIRVAGMRTEPKSETLEELTKLAEAGKLKPIISQVLPLSEGAKAQEQVATRHTRGKIVLKVADAPTS